VLRPLTARRHTTAPTYPHICDVGGTRPMTQNAADDGLPLSVVLGHQ